MTQEAAERSRAEALKPRMKLCGCWDRISVLPAPDGAAGQ